jgi:hypothetical protein
VLVDAAGWPGEKGAGGSSPPLAFQLLTNPVGRAILKAFNPRIFAKGGLKSAYLDETLVTDALIDRYADLALAPGHRDILITQNSRPGRRITQDDPHDNDADARSRGRAGQDHPRRTVKIPRRRHPRRKADHLPARRPRPDGTTAGRVRQRPQGFCRWAEALKAQFKRSGG